MKSGGQKRKHTRVTVQLSTCRTSNTTTLLPRAPGRTRTPRRTPQSAPGRPPAGSLQWRRPAGPPCQRQDGHLLWALKAASTMATAGTALGSRGQPVPGGQSGTLQATKPPRATTQLSSPEGASHPGWIRPSLPNRAQQWHSQEREVRAASLALSLTLTPGATSRTLHPP